MSLKREKKKYEKKYSLWSHVTYLMKDLWKMNRKLLLFMCLEAICMVVAPFVSMYLSKLGVDSVVRKEDTHNTVLIMGLFTIIMVLAQALGNMAARGKSMLLNDVRAYYREKLFCKTLDCEYNHVESPEWQDKYEQAKSMSVDWGPWSATTFLLSGLISLSASIASFFIYGYIIFSLNGWILVMLVTIAGINYISMRHAQRYEQSRFPERNTIQRKRNCMLHYASDIRMGKDIRLYDMGGWIIQIFNNYREAHYRLRSDVMRHFAFSASIEAVTLLLRDGVSYSYLIWAASQGRITLGSFVLISSSIASFSGLITQVSQSVGQIMHAVDPLQRMRAYLDEEEAQEPDFTEKVPAKGEGLEIVFEDVTFGYIPGKPILNHFNLTIHKKEKLALVGVNGAGKSTLVKLLCGLYHPEEGRILFNGTDINHFEKDELFGLIAPVFQESAIFPFTVAENISLKTADDTHKERVIECLKTVGLIDAVQKYENGIDHMMLHITQEDGVLLSGGQQQKLFMARALYKDAPILIFDEPTAALDPIAESETYEQFNQLSKAKTTVYISHRLASTRFCDRIVLFENGEVKASGNHDVLLGTCEAYARMYQLQSQYYNEDMEECI